MATMQKVSSEVGLTITGSALAAAHLCHQAV
jgi:hypothetical protein